MHNGLHKANFYTYVSETFFPPQALWLHSSFCMKSLQYHQIRIFRRKQTMTKVFNIAEPQVNIQL